MPSYRGNLGNILQHWVLCEILRAGTTTNARHLRFVDAHAMSPSTTDRLDATSQLFDRARKRLPGECTPYEVAWNALVPHGSSYPNSAAFLVSLWPRQYSLLLCESDSKTVDDLRTWAETVRLSPTCMNVEVAEGDWRERFSSGIDLRADLLFVSFDPYMFDRNGPGRTFRTGNMYPCDLDRLAAAIAPISQGVVVQLSTYSANNNNPQQMVIDVVSSRVAPSMLEIAAVIRADGNMMSLVLTRNLSWVDSLRELPPRFAAWLSNLKGESGRQNGSS